MTATELVELITFYASKEGVKLTPIRLVKFLYLADLFSARKSGGATLTGWKWRFHNYGPFCVESLQAIESAGEHGAIEVENFVSKFREEPGKLYSFPEESDFDVDKVTGPLSIYVTSSLKNAIRKYGLDTHQLLDYVYFETEPMKQARPGDVLDFSTSRVETRERPMKPRTLSKDTLQKGRALLEQLLVRSKAQEQSRYEVPAKLLDDAYAEGIASMAEEELTPLGELSGVASLETSPGEGGDEG